MRRLLAAAALILATGSASEAATSFCTKGIQDATGFHVQSFLDEAGQSGGGAPCTGPGPFDPVYSLPPGVTVGGGGSGGGSTTWGGASATGAYKAYALAANQAQVIYAQGTRMFLDLSAQNSVSTDIWCALGETAQVGAGNSFRIQAGADARWENAFAPADAVSCIATANTTLFAGAH